MRSTSTDGSRVGNAALSRMEEKSELFVEEEERNEVENWVSERRRLLELRHKRWTWDELRPDVSLSGVASERMDGILVSNKRLNDLPVNRHFLHYHFYFFFTTSFLLPV
jgi:hypothetical protein